MPTTRTKTYSLTFTDTNNNAIGTGSLVDLDMSSAAATATLTATITPVVGQQFSINVPLTGPVTSCSNAAKVAALLASPPAKQVAPTYTTVTFQAATTLLQTVIAGFFVFVPTALGTVSGTFNGHSSQS